MSRADITSSVCAVARNAHNSSTRHWKLVVSYLRGTKGLGKTYVRGSGLGLLVYTDADCAGKTNDRRSVLGFVVLSGVLL